MSLEAQREENMRRNMEVLQALGLPSDAMVAAMGPAPITARSKTKSTKKSTARASTAGKKRSADDSDYENDLAEGPEGGDDDEEEEEKRVKKAPRIDRRASMGTRRSSRSAAKVDINYSEDGDGMKNSRSMPKLVSKAANDRLEEDEGDLPRHKLGQRTNDPKQFGSIPGIPVGKTWELRMHCSTDAVHAPVVAGISGNKNVGAWSIALSGGYEDDVDLGYAFTFTGAGGRDLKGTKQNPKNLRTAPQSKDQDWTENSLNAALKKSSETGKPVRVIRGFKGHSKYAPAEGYRYDGLYTVEKAWMEKGLNKGGFMVCKYAFKRLPDQPAIPERSEDNFVTAGTTDEEETEPESEAADEEAN